VIVARRNSYRLYGSIRILRDGQVRFSPWTFPVLSYLSFMVMNDDHISVEMGGMPVLDLDLSEGRMIGASFRFHLTPGQLRRVVATLRQAGNGLERWIVPALEFTSMSGAFREKHAATYAIVPELLKSCRDLPVADHWKKVRDIVAENEARGWGRAEARKPGKVVEEAPPAPKRGKGRANKRRKPPGRPRKPTVRLINPW
jgi:hypothetical protein